MTIAEPDDDTPAFVPPEGWMETPWGLCYEPETVIECPGTATERETENWSVVSRGYVDEEPVICTGTAVWPLSERYAKLIAAAPELLEALAFIVPQVDDPANGTHELSAFRLGAGMQMARAAIAKAT